MNVRTHTFNGRKYKIEIGEERLDGFCDQYKDEKILSIWVDLDTKNGLITAIHEAMHAVNWAKNEKTVDSCSVDIGNFLWRLGFRRVK